MCEEGRCVGGLPNDAQPIRAQRAAQISTPVIVDQPETGGELRLSQQRTAQSVADNTHRNQQDRLPISVNFILEHGPTHFETFHNVLHRVTSMVDLCSYLNVGLTTSMNI